MSAQWGEPSRPERDAWRLFLALTALAVGLAILTAPDEPATPASPVIYEDDPRWNCATMGNKTCGPESPVVPD